MNNKKLDAAHIWKQFEDVLVPALGLSLTDRAVYSHLLRHTLVEGKARLRLSIAWLARSARVSTGPARQALRRLAERGAVRLIERTRDGHLIEVLHPDVIGPALAAAGTAGGSPVETLVPHSRIDGRSAGSRFPNLGPHRLPPSLDIEELDFLSTRLLREAIHARDRGLCFYCMRGLKPRARCLDHVVPQFRSGGNSYRNLVSCCLECNSGKCHKSAGDFLRQLYREQHLTAAEFAARLRALEALAAGKLRPQLDGQGDPGGKGSRGCKGGRGKDARLNSPG